jgi:hypothetical protein
VIWGVSFDGRFLGHDELTNEKMIMRVNGNFDIRRKIEFLI